MQRQFTVSTLSSIVGPGASVRQAAGSDHLTRQRNVEYGYALDRVVETTIALTFPSALRFVMWVGLWCHENICSEGTCSVSDLLESGTVVLVGTGASCSWKDDSTVVVTFGTGWSLAFLDVRVYLRRALDHCCYSFADCPHLLVGRSFSTYPPASAVRNTCRCGISLAMVYCV